MKPQQVKPVKLIIGILYSDEDLLARAKELLITKFGKLDYISRVFDFTISDYYYKEMGSPIFRTFISHRQHISPNSLAQIKIACNTIEDELAVANQRKVNLDPGYMDYDKFVLASAKYNGQKVYLDLGIYADLTLYYEKAQYHPYPWSFPDFKSGIYNDTFLMIRAKFKGQRRKDERAILRNTRNGNKNAEIQ